MSIVHLYITYMWQSPCLTSTVPGTQFDFKSSLKCHVICEYFVGTVRELSNVRRNAMCMADRQTGNDTARNARAVQCKCAKAQCAQTQCAHSEEWQGSGLFGNYRQTGSRQVVSACYKLFS